MSTRTERWQERTERLLDLLEAAASAWAEAEYQDGLDSGRRGAVSAAVNNRRDKAEAKHKDLVLRLRLAVQRRLPGQ